MASKIVYKRTGEMPENFSVMIRFGKKDQALARRLWETPQAAPEVVREVLRQALASGQLADIIRKMNDEQG